jgi:hypothetical protein
LSSVIDTSTFKPLYFLFFGLFSIFPFQQLVDPDSVVGIGLSLVLRMILERLIEQVFDDLQSRAVLVDHSLAIKRLHVLRKDDPSPARQRQIPGPGTLQMFCRSPLSRRDQASNAATAEVSAAPIWLSRFDHDVCVGGGRNPPAKALLIASLGSQAIEIAQQAKIVRLPIPFVRRARRIIGCSDGIRRLPTSLKKP